MWESSRRRCSASVVPSPSGGKPLRGSSLASAAKGTHFAPRSEALRETVDQKTTLSPGRIGFDVLFDDQPSCSPHGRPVAVAAQQRDEDIGDCSDLPGAGSLLPEIGR